MTVEISKHVNDYIEKLTSEFDVKEIWLFGSRANGMAREDSDWDLWVFADSVVLTVLKQRDEYKSNDIDLMIVYDGDNWEQPWTSIAKRGEERTKHGQLLSAACAFKKIDDETAEYWASKRVGIEINYQKFKAIKIWGNKMKPMSDGVPSNTEMYDRICGGKPLHQGDRTAIEFWDGLIDFSKTKNLLEGNFEGRLKENIHGCFWEIYLPKAFHLNGISLSRTGDGNPDFCFERNGRKVWLEAVVCGEPGIANIVPPPILNGDFESGIAPEAQIMQRLATAVSYKIKKFEESYSQKIQGPDNFYVIALNGYRGINNYVHDRCFQPYILKTLYGMGNYNLFYEGRERVDEGFQFIDKTVKDAPIAHFTKPEYARIAGVLYSRSSVWSCNIPEGEDFVFIQNPYSVDLTGIFDFCKGGIWVRRERQPGRWRIENLAV